MENPFKYGKVVDTPYFTDREKEFAGILRDIDSMNNLVLYSPRRYGKTSLLRKVEKEIQQRGWQTIYIDFYRITSRMDFIDFYAKAILGQYRKTWQSLIKKISLLIKGIRPTVSFDPSGNPVFSISLEPGADIPQTMEEVLNLTENLSDKAKWLVIMDEFQEIVKLNGESFDKLMRSVIQQHKNTVYIFSGSKHHLLLDLFNKPNQAFYKFGKMMLLTKIDQQVMKQFLIERFGFTNILLSDEIAQLIIDKAANIPYYCQYLASEIWQLSILKGRSPYHDMVSEAIENMLDNMQDYYLSQWERLSVSQKKTLVALCQEPTRPFTHLYHIKYNLAAFSSTQRAINKLVELETVDKRASAYHFLDPFFHMYIMNRIANRI